jgi:hypothetical protein
VSSWRSWGAFSAISNASKQVASLTTSVVDNVSQSLSTAMESMSIPEPEEMAKINANEKKIVKEESTENVTTPNNSENVFSLFTNVTKMGLDTLEGIGKKTINILHETDPSIKNKIKSMGGGSNEPNLSDILKEAKERNDSVTATSQNQDNTKGPVSFEQLLDDYKGLVYLEALEILSKQSKMKIELLLKPLAGKALSEMEETIAEVEELCELPDSDAHDESVTSENMHDKLLKATEDLNVKINFNDLVECSKSADNWIATSEDDVNGIYEKSVETLAHLCALSLNNYQKLAELLLSLNHRSTADEADSLTQLTTIYFSIFNLYATKFTEKITSTDSDSKKVVTNVFFEV